MYKPTAKSYFSGAGGMDLGLMNSGIDIIQSLEIDQKCVNTLNKNFKHNVVCADITNVEVLNQIKSDIIVGTYPCTKYSAIADIHGTRTGDELFLHFFRHVALEKPEAYIVENVPGMKKFKVVMEAMTKLPDYYVEVFCPVNSLNWLPQDRKRLIIIGTRKKFNISEPEKRNRIRLKDIIEENPKVHIPDNVYTRLEGKYRDMPIISDPEDENSYAPTCIAHYSKDMGTRLVKDKKFPKGVRPYSVREFARLQGFPDSFEFDCLDSEAYRQIGNAVAVPMAEWVGDEMIKYFNTIR